MRIFQLDELFLSEKHAFCIFIVGSQYDTDIHGHDFDEIFIVTSGSGFHIVNDTVEFIRRGDFLLIKSNDSHRFTSTYNLSVINILIKKEAEFFFLKGIREAVKGLEATVNVMNSLSSNEIDDITKIVTKINSLSDYDYDENYFISVESMFFMIISILINRTHNTKKDVGEIINEPCFFIIDMIKKNFNKPMSWEKIMLENDIKKRTMFRSVNKVSGISPDRLLGLYRLYKAQEMIRTTNLSIGEIASACGFSNITRLSERYKEQFSYSPSNEKDSDHYIWREKDINGNDLF